MTVMNVSGGAPILLTMLGQMYHSKGNDLLLLLAGRRINAPELRKTRQENETKRNPRTA